VASDCSQIESDLRAPSEFRRFVEHDMDRVLEIERSSFSEGIAYPRARFEELYKEHPTGCLVAEIQGEIVGYIIVYAKDGVGQLDSLAVDVAFRRLGSAKDLSTGHSKDSGQ
jgi:ribosomal protein S18 acetylase RimI-like enzyme